MDCYDCCTWPTWKRCIYHILVVEFLYNLVGKEALDMLNKMIQSGTTPNSVTLINILNACSHVGLIDEGLNLFHNMEAKFGVTPTIDHKNCIVDLLGKLTPMDRHTGHRWSPSDLDGSINAFIVLHHLKNKPICLSVDY